ncbi:MAG: hypothetical protein K9K37_12205 [Desulfocapsa sp.]|nr:hypothetical protein [Desulfocapsa sp.]
MRLKIHHIDAFTDTVFQGNYAAVIVLDEWPAAAFVLFAEERVVFCGAWLDVFSEEPFPQSSPLWQLDNVIITPHYCDAVEDWHERFVDFFATNLQRWQAGKNLHNCLS